jgi:hypothetical protein
MTAFDPDDVILTFIASLRISEERRCAIPQRTRIAHGEVRKDRRRYVAGEPARTREPEVPGIEALARDLCPEEEMNEVSTHLHQQVRADRPGIAGGTAPYVSEQGTRIAVVVSGPVSDRRGLRCRSRSEPADAEECLVAGTDVLVDTRKRIVAGSDPSRRSDIVIVDSRHAGRIGQWIVGQSLRCNVVDPARIDHVGNAFIAELAASIGIGCSRHEFGGQGIVNLDRISLRIDQT